MRSAVLVFAVCAVACFVAHVAILRSVVRAASDRTPLEPGVPRPSFVVELIWAVVPMLALAIVLTATWARIQSTGATESRPEPMMQVAR